ncbi:MAG TPA: HEPN domain-containing protein, partial [Planctomycetota bacterium]|nr:HEPN domain-containing protein [Planctomycetota bacterium]
MAEDLRAAETLLKASVPPIPWTVICFHAQQAAEKWLKGWLAAHAIRPPRTHDLARLCDLATALEPRFGEIRERVASLTDLAVAPRYADEPGEPGSEEAEHALGAARLVREFIDRLG